jgi:hypothetical protein
VILDALTHAVSPEHLSQDPVKQLTLIRALADLGDRRGVPSLDRLLYALELNTWVRDAAKSAVQALGGNAELEALKNRHDFAVERIRSKIALFGVRVTADENALTFLKDNSFHHFVLPAISLLRHFGRFELVPELEPRGHVVRIRLYPPAQFAGAVIEDKSGEMRPAIVSVRSRSEGQLSTALTPWAETDVLVLTCRLDDDGQKRLEGIVLVPRQGKWLAHCSNDHLWQQEGDLFDPARWSVGDCVVGQGRIDGWWGTGAGRRTFYGQAPTSQDAEGLIALT